MARRSLLAQLPLFKPNGKPTASMTLPSWDWSYFVSSERCLAHAMILSRNGSIVTQLATKPRYLFRVWKKGGGTPHNFLDARTVMTTISFYARGDSSSANNAALNVQGTSTTPVTLLSFSSSGGGDIKLDYNGGLPDPDTTLIINGVSMTFTVEFSGTLPTTNKLANVNGENLRGKEIVVITAQDGSRFFFLTDGSSAATMEAFPNGAHAIGSVNSTAPVLICFVRGTLIATPSGERLIETLKEGDLVLNDAGTSIKIRWIGSRRIEQLELARFPRLRPLRIPIDFFGPGRPHTALKLSPQHRIALGGWQLELLFGVPDALVPACHLLGVSTQGSDTITTCENETSVEYFHLLFDEHELVYSNGLLTESYQPSVRNVAGLAQHARQELLHIFPAHDLAEFTERQDRYLSLRAHESKAWSQMAYRRRPPPQAESEYKFARAS